MAGFRYSETNSALFRDEARELRADDTLLYQQVISLGGGIVLLAVFVFLLGLLVLYGVASHEGVSLLWLLG